MATTTLRAICDQARRLLEQNDVDRSIAVAQHILEHFPDNLEAHRILGEAYLASRQFDQAQEAFSRVLYADPENIPALVGLGITYERQGKVDGAVREFEQALEIKSDLKELREQLLRLYTDSWGAERAQLRLSKPGLARLYAKGHMLPQAIQEFRSVIDDDPDRFDARVGLAEVLWRDGQEEAAALTCEEMLTRRDDVLKANLLLGYMKLAAGDPQGQHYWSVAQRLDPYQGVAHALFETLPTVEDPQTTLPDWDEGAWVEHQEQAERERRTQLEEELAARSPVVQPEEEFFAHAWLDPTEEKPPSTAATAFDTAPDDDFLASLLAFEALDQHQLAEVTDQSQASMDSEYAESDLKPFTLDDLDHPEPAAPPVVVPDVNATPDLPSEDDFNLDALLVPEAVTEEHAPSSAEGKAEEMELQTFSLDDLGLSDEDIAALDMASELSATTGEQPPAPGTFADEPLVREDADVQPFSLNDLGLSDEELASLDLGDADVGLDPGMLSEEPQFADDLMNLKPFDWSPEAGFSAEKAANDQVFESDVIDDLQPFSLDDLDLSDSALDEDMDRSSLPPSLQPFSLDDLGDMTLPPDTTSNTFGSPISHLPEEEEGGHEPSAFGWQQPASKSNTDFLRHGRDTTDSDEPEETSIFAKLKQRRQELPEEEEVPLPPVSIEKHDSLDLFSDDDISLRDDDEDSNQVVQELPEPEPAQEAEPELTLFSLDDLGLSGDEIAGLNLGQTEAVPGDLNPAQAAEPELTPFSLSELGLSAEEIAALEAGQTEAEPGELEPAQPTTAEPELTPFSLDELGLSADEMVGLDLGQTEAEPGELEPAQPTTAEPELTPFSLDELGLSADEMVGLDLGQTEAEPGELEPAQPTTAEPELTPFSLDELGLSADEMVGLDLGQTEAEPGELEPAQPTAAEPELTPFSLSELGLSAEEIAALEAGQTEARLGEPAEPEVSQAAEEPELTPFSLSELGLSAEEIAALDISDADAVDSMPSTESTEPPPASDESPAVHSAPPDAPAAQPEVTPFSLGDWGLDDDFSSLDAEIADLSRTENQSAMAEPLGDIQPFSLSDLGLGAEESTIFGAALRSDQSELGLTEEELADLNIGMFGDDGASRDMSSSPVDYDQELTGDFELDKLIRLGRQQGFVDLTDIIDIVDNPVAQPERIEEIGQALHLAGIEIRDGDEVIDMDEEYLEEDIAVLDDEQGDDLLAVDGDETDLAPFSLGELGLSAEEIAALGLEDDQSEVALPAAEPVAEPELTPFSLTELGLTPEEIAALEQGEQAAEPETSGAAESVAEPELTPFSLAELGLTPEEIAALEHGEQAMAAPPEPKTETEAPVLADPATEPELMPFSLAELGLTPEEIAVLEQGEQATIEVPEVDAPAAAEPSAEPELAPFSLAELGLSPDEIASVQSSSTNKPSIDMLAAAVAGLSASKGKEQDKDEDVFDFSVVDEHRDELATPVKRTEPRKHEEEVRPVSPEDAAFEPEELDTLDNIWEMVDTQLATPPVIPAPPVATPPEPPPAKPAPARGRSVPATARPAVTARSAAKSEPVVPQQPKPAAKSEPVVLQQPKPAATLERERRVAADNASSSAKSVTGRSSWRKSPTSFIPTGDETLDEYLRQIEIEPENHGLRLAIARLAGQTGRDDLALYEYKHLIKDKIALDQVVDELQELIEESEDRQVLQRLYRLLGDAYSQQSRFREAIAAYSWTFTS